MLRVALDHPRARLVVSTNLPGQVEMLSRWGFRTVQCDELDERATAEAAIAWAEHDNRRLPEILVNSLARAPRMPAWIRFAVQELAGVDADVFRRAEALTRAGSSAAEALTETLLQEANSFSPELEVIVGRVLSRALDAFATRAHGVGFLRALALSRSGLTIQEIETTTGASTPEITRARWVLGSMIELFDPAGRLSFGAPWLCTIALRQAEAMASKLAPLGESTPSVEDVHTAIARVLDPSSVDPVERLDAFWHALHGLDAHRLVDSLMSIGGVLTEVDQILRLVHTEFENLEMSLEGCAFGDWPIPEEVNPDRLLPVLDVAF